MSGLIIDDDYFDAMGAYAFAQGKRINETSSSYTEILNTVRHCALISGELAGALDAFILYAEKINTEILEICDSMCSQIKEFLAEVDEKDRL